MESSCCVTWKVATYSDENESAGTGDAHDTAPPPDPSKELLAVGAEEEDGENTGAEADPVVDTLGDAVTDGEVGEVDNVGTGGEDADAVGETDAPAAIGEATEGFELGDTWRASTVGAAVVDRVGIEDDSGVITGADDTEGPTEGCVGGLEPLFIEGTAEERNDGEGIFEGCFTGALDRSQLNSTDLIRTFAFVTSSFDADTLKYL